MTWPVLPLGEVAETALGKMLDKGKPKGYPHVPYLRNINVQWGRIETTDLLTMELPPDQRERFGVQAGDLLVCEGGEIGRAAIWQGRTEYIAYQKALHRIRPGGRLESLFLRYLLEHLATSGALARFATGTTIAHLPQQQLRRVPVPLPSLSEQHRIVDLLEDHLSHLDAADAYLDASLRRANTLLQRVRESVWQDTDERIPILELGDVVTGKTPPTSDPRNAGSDVPFVTPGDVGHGQEIRQVERSLSHQGAAGSRVVPGGSVLAVCIGATLGKVGYTSRPVAFNQQVNGVVLPGSDEAELIAALIAAPSFQRTMRKASSATTMPILNKSVFSRLSVPLVPAEHREEVIQRIRTASDAVDRFLTEVGRASVRSAALRRSLLAAAFSGRLTADPELLSANEPVSA